MTDPTQSPAPDEPPEAVRVPVTDPGDQVTEWVFSTRTPDRVIAAIQRAQRDAGRR